MKFEDVGKGIEQGSEAAEHLKIQLGFVSEEFKQAIEAIENLLEQGMMNYEYLWTIFSPGATVYVPVFGQSRAFIPNHYVFNCDPSGLMLNTEYVDFDGNDMELRNTDRRILRSRRIQQYVSLPD